MTATDGSDAVMALWEIEVSRRFGVHEWLIRLAETTYDHWGGDDPDKWDLNQHLRLAIDKARARITERRMSQDFYAEFAVEDAVVTDLANAIAIRLGEDTHSNWSADLLAALAKRAPK